MIHRDTSITEEILTLRPEHPLVTAARAGYEKFFEGLIGCVEPKWIELPNDHKVRLIEAHRFAIAAFDQAVKDR